MTITSDNSTAKPIRRIGFIGLGIMGLPMATNLLKAGYEVIVWNRTASKAKPILEQGAHWANSPQQIALKAVEVIHLNVSDTPDVQAVVSGDRGILQAGHQRLRGLIIIDHSTISPQATKDLAQLAATHGATWLDAPVSGGDVGARNGTLSMMVGGDIHAFNRCLPLLQVLGKQITHLGPAGMGQLCKACNQVAVGVNLLGVCEAMALAHQGGLDLEKMIQVVAHGAGSSWQLSNLGTRIAQGDMSPGFMINLMLKDLAIVTATAKTLGLSLKGLEQAKKALEQVQSSSERAGQLGTQAMSQTIEKQGHFQFHKS